MTAIVVNTKTGAVSEYDWTFQSLTPTFAGDATGMYTLGGDTDNGVQIEGSILTGSTLLGTSMIKLLDAVYFSLASSGQGKLLLKTNSDAVPREYLFDVHPKRESRGKPPRGLRENYLAFGYANVGGVDFHLDRIEVPAGQSATRRV